MERRAESSHKNETPDSEVVGLLLSPSSSCDAIKWMSVPSSILSKLSNYAFLQNKK